jgi:ATP-dependent helicase/nuclease subunit A
LSKTFTIYRSSAGSGKTRTLAKEYLKLALRLRSHYFKHILAVTFTNKATQEMKDRILAYLDEFANGKGGDLASELKAEMSLDDLTFQQYAQEAQSAILHEYSHFAISTIDAFFQKVIRSFTREAGLTGDYRLEIDQDPVLEEVIDALIDELGNNRNLTEWVVEFAKENLENERSWDVRSNLLDFSREIFREEFKTVEDEVARRTSDPLYFRNLKNRLGEIRGKFIAGISKPAREALAILSNQEWTIADLNYGKSSGINTFLETCATLRRVKELKEPGVRVKSFSEAAANWANKKSPFTSAILAVAENELVPRLARIVDRMEAGLTEALTAEVALENLYVFGLVSDISRKLKEYKDENNLMLLADAPKFLNGVIQDSDTPFIYEKVGSFYRNYLIDEFQDTSGLQWSNFLPLLSNSLDQGYSSLVVGDVKQAIYRWRGGDLNLLQNEVEKNVGKERVEVKNLDSNYRSAATIVDFNNALFTSASAIVSLETGAALSSASYGDVSQKVYRDTEGYVQIRFLEEEKDGQRWKDQALALIPGYLERLQDAGVQPKDIAFLVRKNEEGQEIISHLLQHKSGELAKPGYSYEVVSGESLRITTAATVNLLEGAMKYLLNPDDDIARSQIAYEFARIFDPNRPLTEVFAVTNQSIFESSLPAAFTREKASLKKLPLFELTETLIRIFRLGEQQGELPFLQAFQNLVLDFFTRERNDLGAFLEWWDDNKAKKSIPVSGKVDAAQIISMHKSKGLQFKYVIIPFCSWAIDHDNYNAPQLWVNSEEGIFKDAGYIPVKYSPVLAKTFFKDFYQEEFIRTYLDNLNLLYVAMTRAETGLIAIAPDPEKGPAKKSVTNLLYRSITQSSELQASYDPVKKIFETGRIGVVKQPENNEPENTLTLRSYSVADWREKLVIRQQAYGFFDQTLDPKREKINYGIHIHEVLSRITTADEIPSELEKLVFEGVLSVGEKDPLAAELNSLLSDERIQSWFRKGWEVKTEVPIILPGGTENRIDRLMVHDKKAVIVDFKTGTPTKADQKQVLEYMDILRKMNYLEVEGYLLYTRTGEVVSVMPQKTKVVKRKDDSQLDLGLGL